MKTIPLALLGIIVLTGLTGCSGSANGVYYGTYNSGKPHTMNGDFVRLMVDGDDVVFDRIRCDGPSERKTSQGVLNDRRDTVSWTVEGNYHGTDPFIENTDRDVVTLAQTIYLKEGSDAAEALIDDYVERCDRDGEEWTNPL